jgi:hypothetical protein
VPVKIYDFIAEAPNATWTSNFGANVLPFNGSDVDPLGFVVWRDNAQLEDGSIPPRVLETHPEWVNGGRIVGDFTLPGPIKAGDRFKAKVGFLAGAGGAVEFVVAAMGGSLGSVPVAVSVEDTATDGMLKTIDADLTPLAGGAVIRLLVDAGESSGQDWAVWVEARIER